MANSTAKVDSCHAVHPLNSRFAGDSDRQIRKDGSGFGFDYRHFDIRHLVRYLQNKIFIFAGFHMAVIIPTLLLLALPSFAQVFPTRIAGDEDLFVATNKPQATLSVAVNSSIETIVLSSGTGFTSNQILVLNPPLTATAPDNSEYVFCRTLTGATYTSCTRGYDGSTPRSHAQGVPIRAFVLAAHHNNLREEIQAIEGEIADNRAFNFTLTNGTSISGDLSTAGAKTVTIAAPYACPRGTNGADASHPLRIAAGTGTPEVVTITGGTCVAGSTGTLQFTTANTHTGAWTVTSATAGIQELVLHVGVGMVQVATGDWLTYAPVTVVDHVWIWGRGEDATIIKNQSTTTDAIRFVLPNMTTATKSAGISGLSIYSGPDDYDTDVDNTAGEGIFVSGANHGMRINRVTVKNHDHCIDIQDSQYVYITNFTIFYCKTAGIRLGGTSGVAGVYMGPGAISNFGYTGTPDGANAGLDIQNGFGIYADLGKIDVTSFHNGVAVRPGSGQSVAHLWFLVTVADSTETRGWLFDGTNGAIKTVHMLDCYASWAGNHDLGAFESAGVGALFQGANIDGVFVKGGRFRENGGDAISILGGTNIHMDGLEIAQNSQFTDATYNGVGIGAGVSKWSLKNSRCGNFASGFTNEQAYCLVIAAGASDDFKVIGNDMTTNATGPYSDGATGVNRVIRNNLGIDDVVPQVAAGATIALPWNPVVEITGTTAAIATMTGGWEGREATLIFTDGAPDGVTTGGSAGHAFRRVQAAVQYQAIRVTKYGSFWY